MTRKQPPAPPDVVERKTDIITQVRRYKLITPLFGGGVETKVADPVTVVRGTEVRGHLRFWWRATRGYRSSDLAELSNRESFIWGSTERESQVQIRIHEISKGTPEIAFQVRANDRGKPVTVPSSQIAAYAAFPLLPDRNQQSQLGWQSAAVLLNVAFELELQYPESLSTDVEDALWAWEIFGGIGGRTRRGFGAISYLDERTISQMKDPTAIKEEISKKLATFDVPSKWAESIPNLGVGVQIEITQLERNPTTAWKNLIDKLHTFRQMRYKKFGLSQWPEANEIRRLFKVKPKLPDGVPSTRLVKKFPRAAFGLPIVFHMPHDKRIADNVTLQGNDSKDKHYDRLSSRLILRPLTCADRKAVGIALVLNAPSAPPNGLMLKGAPGNPSVQANLDKDTEVDDHTKEIDQIPPLKGNPDVLQAFLDYLK